MVLSSSETKGKSIPDLFGSSLLPRFTLRSVKRIAVGLLACLILAFLVFWQPAYLKIKSLQKEKDSRIVQMSTGFGNGKLIPNWSVIPTMDQLPDIIEKCRSAFVKEGVNVVGFNVERFGEKQETGKEASIDYSLVRLRLHGQWSGITSSLKVLEEAQEVSIHVQEVVLASTGGEVLLQIFFCSGE